MTILWLPGIIIRLLVPLTIRRWPLLGAFLAMLADTLDVVIWDISGIENIGAYYNVVDKLLDTYMYLIMGWVVWDWQNQKARLVGLGLLAWRMVGVVVFSLTHLRYVLLFFPDIFIFFYFAYLIAQRLIKQDYFVTYRRILGLVAVLSVPKLFQEYLFHVAEFPVYQFFRPLVEAVAGKF